MNRRPSALANSLRHLSLRQRFLVAPLLGLLLLAAYLTVFIHESQHQSTMFTNLAEHQLAASNQYSELFVSLSTQHLALYNLMATTNKGHEETIYTQSKERLQAIREVIGGIERTLQSQAKKAGEDIEFEAQQRYLLLLTQDYLKTVTTAVEMTMVDVKLAATQVALANKSFETMNRAFSQLLESQRQRMAAEIEREVKHSRLSNAAYSITAVSGAVLLFFLSIALTRILSRSLETQIARLVQLGDSAGIAMEDRGGDEVQRIARAIEAFDRTQRELHDSELRFRSFFEHNNAVMLLIDPADGMICGANEAAARFYGYPRERLRCMNIDQINQLPPEQIRAEGDAGLNSRRNYFVFPHRLANGQIRTVEVHATPIAAAGKTFLFSIIHDITERVRAEESLRKGQQLIQSILDHSGAVVFVKDLAGRYVLVNQRFAKLFQSDPAAILNRTDYDLYPAELADRRRDADRQAIAAGQATEFEEQVPQQDGLHTFVAIKCPLYDEGGKVYAVCGVATDITERKRAQEALKEANRDLELRVSQRTAQLDAANRAKSDFLAVMSHEIRTPLNTVIGMAYLALRGELDPKQREYVENIHSSGQHLLGLIDAILDFSKIEAGKLDLEKIDFSLDQVIKNLNNLVAVNAAAKGLKFVVDLDPALPNHLRGDPLRLGQVLINFTSNAVKFTNQGEILVRARIIEERSDGYLVLFEVKDTGIGMDAEEKQKIFLAFRQADSSTTRRYGGTGLGLAISKQLVTLMGGEVGVSSLPDYGSTFWFTVPLGKGLALPVKTSTEVEHDPADLLAAATAAIKGAHILLVDDHPFNLQLATAFLEDVGATVQVAGNGREALELLRRQPFDCVLMDVQMPEMDGLAATRAIRADPELAANRVIAMTANAWNEDRRQCLAAGMDGFISKPIHPEQLYATIAHWLPQRCPEGAPAAPVALPTVGTAVDFSGDPRIIDLAVPAKTLRNDPAKIRRVALKFLSSARDDTPRIEAALESGDLITLRALGHRIKSPARAVGAIGLADLCQALEHINDDGLDQARQIVDQLRPLLDQIAGHIERNPLFAESGRG
ncbi:MAG TPA: response regulator [Rhodocyclaceae bacterium]